MSSGSWTVVPDSLSGETASASQVVLLPSQGLEKQIQTIRQILWELGQEVRVVFPGKQSLDLDLLGELLEWGLPTGKTFRVISDGQRNAVVVTPGSLV